MKKLLVAAALAATLAQPASAITFSKLTTIYVGTGVHDDGSAANLGIATAFICTNVSGFGADVRFAILNPSGNVVTSIPFRLSHGETSMLETHSTAVFDGSSINTGGIIEGGINFESTQSGVFCNAWIVDAANAIPAFMAPLNLVRVNPHPGTAE